MLDGDTVFEVNKHVVYTEIDDEFVLLHTERGIYFGLNVVGAVVWKLLSEQNTLDQVCLAIMEKYDIEERQLRADVTGLTEKLVEEGLVAAK